MTSALEPILEVWEREGAVVATSVVVCQTEALT